MLRNIHLIILFVICVSSQALNTQGACSWDGIPGRCVSVFRCLSAVKDIETKKYPPLCHFEGNTPVICCTDCDLVNDTRLYLFNPQLGLLNKTGTIKAKDKCLDYIHSVDYPCKRQFADIIYKTELDQDKNCTNNVAIRKFSSTGFAIGGRNALKEEYPHMALLGFGDDIETASWLCGGSVISERYILTAAHCLSGPSVGSVKYIGLGMHKRSDPVDLWQRYNVKNAIPHPEYKPPSKYHDIALLETDKEISFGSVVRPACLHVDDETDPYAYATGWGATGHRQDLADILQSVGLSQFTDEECSRFYPPHRHLLRGYDAVTQMCYGDKDIAAIPTDTCEVFKGGADHIPSQPSSFAHLFHKEMFLRAKEGDSGGPLQSQSHELCGVYTILGVTSYGRQCGKSGGSGVYTRVRHYVPWIESIVWP